MIYMELEKLLRKISDKCKREFKGNHRFAFFHDANNELQVVCIVTSKSMYGFGPVKYKFISFNRNGEKTGFINIEDELDNVYLAEVYTMTNARGKGIASELSYIMDYYLKSINKEYIYGVYMPQQMSDDALKGVRVSKEELDKRARKYYESIGFSVMDADMLEAMVEEKKISVFSEQYFDLCSLFIFGDKDAIVYKSFKDIDPESKYHIEGEYLVQNGLDNKEVNDLINKDKSKVDKLRSLLLSFGWSESKVDSFIELNNEYNLLNDKNYKNRKLPKDIVYKLKELSTCNNREEVYSGLYEIYLSMKERYIDVKR